MRRFTLNKLSNASGLTMVPIMAKPNAILSSKCVNTWEYWYSLGKELKIMMILPLKNSFYSAIILQSDFEDFSIITTNNSYFKVNLTGSLLINKGHPFSNKKNNPNKNFW